MSNTLRIAGLTDVGRTRSRNEDSYRLSEDLGAAIVADGMGGHPGGDIASRTAADAALDELERCLSEGEEVLTAMARTVAAAQRAIRERGEMEPALDGMGTTLTALTVRGGTYAIGHVGDSRAYLLRDGELRVLTRDDTWVQARVEAGDLTPEAARSHPYGHMLTQCVGLPNEPSPQLLSGTVHPGDRFLVCSDGLIGMLDGHAIREALIEFAAAGPDAACRQLVDAANEAGGLDNITVVIAEVGESA